VVAAVVFMAPPAELVLVFQLEVAAAAVDLPPAPLLVVLVELVPEFPDMVFLADPQMQLQVQSLLVVEEEEQVEQVIHSLHMLLEVQEVWDLLIQFLVVL
jgi:hypothetical protein